MAGILSQIGVPSLNSLNMGAGNTSVTTPSTNFSTPTGVTAANPSQNVKAPSNTISPQYAAPSSSSSTSSGSIGAYKGTPIYGGSEASIQSQMAVIDAGQSGTNSASSTTGAGNLTFPTSTSTNNNISSTTPTGTDASATTGNYTAYNTATGAPTVYGTGSPGTTAPATNTGFLNQLMANTGNSQYDTDNANLQALKNEQATLEQNIAGGDQPLYFKQGEMGQEQQAYQTKLAAASQAVQNDIAEQGAQTTAATAGATATLPGNQNYAVPSGQNVINAQGQPVASGPILSTPGQAFYNPGTGTTVGGTTGGTNPATAPAGYTQQAWNQYIQDYASGNFGAIPSDVTGNVNISGQLQAAVSAANPGFSYNNALGAGQGQQTVAANSGNITAQQQTTIAAYKSAQQQGQNLASQASDLIQQFDLNPSQLNLANGAIQKIALNTSNPQYQILNNYLSDISARYSQILTPPGGTATDTTRAVATGMLNSLAQGTSLETVLSALDQQADAVIAGVSTTGAGGASTNTSASNTGTTAVSPWH